MSDEHAEFLGEDGPYGDERGREYHAARGGKRCPHLRFVLAQGDYDRQLPYHDIRDTFIRKDGTAMQIEFSHVVAVITGRNLLAVANAIGAHGCSCVEAFNPLRRDLPPPEAPFVKQIAFYDHPEERGQAMKGEGREAGAPGGKGAKH